MGTTPAPGTPLRLSEAVKLAFPHGGMTVSGLRRERDHGRLAVFKIAGKDFTTLADIGRMMELCRSEAKGPDCGLSQGDRSETRAPCGSSATAQTNTALALARAKVSKLKERSPTTSSPTQASRERATVIPLKSASTT
jgi:hypothetical protein